MSENTQLSGRQIAAGRVLAGIGQAELAARARISVPTLRRMEASDGEASGYANNVAAVRAALEAAGVIFVEENGDGPGVRLRRHEAGRAHALGHAEAAADRHLADVDAHPDEKASRRRAVTRISKDLRNKSST